MIEFKSLDAVNFMTFGRVVYQFPRSGFHLVEGVNEDEEQHRRSNGSGKSTLLEALVWCLYGRTLRELPNADAVIRKGAKSPASVRVNWLSADGVTFNLMRTRAEGSSKLVFGSLPGVSLNLTQGTIEKTQVEVEKALGMDFRAFCAAVAFGGASAYKFTSLSNQERRQVLDDAAGASLWTRAAEHAKKERADEEVALADDDRKLASAKEALSTARDDLRAAKEDTARREPDAERLRVLRRRLKREEAIVYPCDEDLLHQRQEARSAAEQVLSERVEACSSWRTIRRKLVADIRRLNEKGFCPTCGTDLGQAAASTIAKLEKDLFEARKGFEDANDEVKDARIALAKAEQGVEEIEREKQLRRESRIRIKAIKREIEVLASHVAEGHGSGVEEARKKLREAKEAFKEAKQEQDQRRRSLAVLRFLERAFSPGLTTAAIDEAVPELNRVAIEASSSLTDGRDRIYFSTQAERRGRKELGIVVESECGADSYGARSEGEKAQVDLCAGLAIQNLVAGRSRCNLAFYDEVFDSLDDVASERVLALLRAQAKEKAVFLITHRESLAGASFDEVIQVIKRKGSSMLQVVKP